jgi:S-adenosyl-L-methionine hydrolase (adenosine-forming)
MASVITLTTDFGLTDVYVGIVKGAILSVSPDATIVDITHSIEPQNVVQGAFMLNNAYRYFPKQSVHMAIVDPGVGGARRGVILKTPTALFVAPDNGILSYVLNELSMNEDFSSQYPQPYTEVLLGEGLEAVIITDPRFWRQPVSSTFHARDIFAPVAAGLSLGISPYEFGEKLNSLHVFPTRRPLIDQKGNLTGHIVWIDHYGNLVTDIRGTDLPQRDIEIEIAGYRLHGLARYYKEANRLIAIIGSNGYLEISLPEGNACDYLHATVADEVRVLPLSY